MSKPEPYSKGLSQLQSQHRKGEFTSPHVRVLSILSANHVSYLAEEVVRIWGVWDSRGSVLACKCDIIVIDPNFGCGVIEVEGAGSNSRDNATRDRLLLKAGMEWIEHIPNSDVENVLDYLRKHERQVGEWP